MSQDSYIKQLLLVLLGLMLTSSLLGQLQLIDQYIYKSDTDSIRVGDYLDPTKNEILLIYPSSCEGCLLDILAYEPLMQRWDVDYDLAMTILIQPDQWQFTTASLIHQVELNTEFEVFLINGDFDSTSSHLYSKSLKYQSVIPQFLNEENLQPYLDSMLSAESIQDDLLGSNVLQCAVDVSNCDEPDTVFMHINNLVEIGTYDYTELVSISNQYLIRLDAINRDLYYYNPVDNIEHLLYSLDGFICDSIKIYSVSEDKYLDGIITDYWNEGDDEYWATDIDIQCQDSDDPLIISTQYGTNAGLVPQFENGMATSQLLCHYEASRLEYGDLADCPSDKIDQLSQLRVYPNPVGDMLFVEAGIHTIDHIAMFNIRGQVIIADTDYDGPIIMSGLSSGVYFLAVTSEGKLTRYRVIKY